MRWTTDVERGSWLRERMGESMDALVTPPGFEAYARVFHPVNRTGPGESEEQVTWAQVAQAFGTTMDPLTSYQALIRGPATDFENPVDSAGTTYWGPSVGSLDRGTLAIVAEHARAYTTDPSQVIAAIWAGWGGLTSAAGRAAFSILTIGGPAPWRWLHGRAWLLRGRAASLRARLPGRSRGECEVGSGLVPADVAAGPHLELPARSYLLCQADLADFITGRWTSMAPWLFAEDSPEGAQSPSLLWPADHAWVISTEIDLDSTVVAGPRALIEALSGDDRLEVMAIGPDARFGWDPEPPNPR